MGKSLINKEHPLTFCKGRPVASKMSRRSSSVSQSSELSSDKLVVVITGGSGVLGSQIARLIHEQWEDVIEIRLFDIVHPDQSLVASITGYATPSSKPKVSYYHGSVLDPNTLATAFVRADVVIHCAAIVESGSVMSRRRMREVNIDGTQNVIQCCLECGVKALVYTGSTTQALTIQKNSLPLRMNEKLSKTTSYKDLVFPDYGGSKNEAENLVLLANGQEGKRRIRLATCSLRCPPLFGEGDKSFMMAPLKIAKQCKGYYVPVGLSIGCGITMQSLYIGNGAWAHVVAARRLLSEDEDSIISGQVFYIGDHSPVCSSANFQKQFLHPLGFKLVPIGIPLFILVLLAYVIEFVCTLLAFVRIDVPCLLNRSSMQYFKVSHSFSWEKACQELGYEPLYSHSVALARSMEYYRKFI